MNLIKELLQLRESEDWTWQHGEASFDPESDPHPYIHSPDDREIAWSITGYSYSEFRFECSKHDLINDHDDTPLEKLHFKTEGDVIEWCNKHGIPAPTKADFKYLEGGLTWLNSLKEDGLNEDGIVQKAIEKGAAALCRLKGGHIPFSNRRNGMLHCRRCDALYADGKTGALAACEKGGHTRLKGFAQIEDGEKKYKCARCGTIYSPHDSHEPATEFEE
jgi:uncharacterized C2H2 Zn-finger protein